MSSTIQKNTKVTSKNINEIQELLAKGEGGILTVDPNWVEHPDYGCTMYLYAQAEIEGSDAKGWNISTKRGTKKVEGEDCQTGWENDREYVFRLHRTGEETYPNKVLGGFAFFLGMHSTVYKNFRYVDHSLAIYIPKDGGDRRGAVFQGLTHVIDVTLKMCDKITDVERADLWQYVGQDLEDGKALHASLIGC